MTGRFKTGLVSWLATLSLDGKSEPVVGGAVSGASLLAGGRLGGLADRSGKGLIGV